MEFLILGPTAFLVDGRHVHLGPAKQRGLLAVLLYHVPDPVRIDLIVDQLWHGQRVVDSRSSLHPLISRVRAKLREAGLGQVLIRDPGLNAYRLDVEPELIDLHRFRRLLRQGRKAYQDGQRDLAVDLLTQAINLWRGEPLAELGGGRVEYLREALQNALLDAQRLLAENLLASGRQDDALNLLEPLIVANPMDESLARLWVITLKSLHRYGEVLTFVARFRRRYRKEMKAEPIIDFSDLLRADQGNVVPVANGHRAASDGENARTDGSPRQLPNDIHDFTGHAALLTTLDSFARANSEGPNVVVLTGPPAWERRRWPDTGRFSGRTGFPTGSST